MYSKNFLLSILMLLVMTCYMNLVHANYSFAHNSSVDTSTAVISEAQFYGIPTFDIEIETTGESHEDTEMMRSRFWGIAVQSGQ